MDLSIIIVNYNTKELLLRCMNSIIQHGGLNDVNCEIIVVDNGSEDIESIKYQVLSIKYENKIKIIQNEENLGFGTANNQGAKIAKGEYLLFLNTDIEALDNAIGKMIRFIKTKEKADVVGGKLFNMGGSSQPSCGPFYSLPVVFASLFLKGDKIGLTRWSPGTLTKVDWVSGACLMMKKTAFEKLGGFDEKIFMYMDEIDLLYRARQKNYRVYFYPDAKFIHLGAATSKKISSPIINIYEGLLYFYQKHYSAFDLKVLKFILKSKARMVIIIAILLNKVYLKETYAKAYKLVG